jgi:cysteinyl-tRNA synthetase
MNAHHLPEIKLYNSLTRQTEVFKPRTTDEVTLYVCGPTVYNYAHIGNARPPVVFGLLVKLLERRYAKVVYARNITDIDDKINAAAREQNVSIQVIAERYTKAYREDMQALGVAPPTIEPQATQTVDTIIGMIETLIEKQCAYVAENHVLFAIDQFKDYGALSGRSTDEMIAGARIEVAPYKRNPGDFVLWKPSDDETPGWPSPWGRGRPGWHIECSAMSALHLGKTIDIHGGGTDLKFPHHENEIAQSTCAHDGQTFARYWLHNGFVTVEGKKMSKSLGNVLLVKDLRHQAPPEALRLLLLSAHYRQPLDWSQTALTQAVRTLDRLYALLRDMHDVPALNTNTIPSSFEAALCDDLNTPKALAVLSELADTARKASSLEDRKQSKTQLLAAGALLGLLQQTPDAWFAQSTPKRERSPSEITEIESMLEQRQQAKQNKNFAVADAIRTELTKRGVVLEDTPQGTRWS